MANTTTDPALLILISLAAGPRHGHGMLHDIAGFAGVRLGPGTLYGAIGRLEEDGLISPMPAQERRRPYRLTRRGRRLLEERLHGLRATLREGLERVRT